MPQQIKIKRKKYMQHRASAACQQFMNWRNYIAPGTAALPRSGRQRFHDYLHLTAKTYCPDLQKLHLRPRGV